MMKNVIVEDVTLEGAPISEDIHQINRDLLYAYKQARERGQDIEGDEFYRQIEKIARHTKQDPIKILEEIKDQVSFEENTKRGGDFYESEIYGLKKGGPALRDAKQPDSLRDFARESESEREDQDILDHYRKKLSETQKAQAKLDKLTAEERIAMENAKDLMPEMPNLETYYKSIAEGKHPFEQDKYKFDQDEELKKQREKEEKYDEELYQRELQGRLYGEKLTPR